MSQVDDIMAELTRAVEDVMVRLSTNITAELIEATPVDVGWAQLNWIPAIGQTFDENQEALSRAAREAAVPAQGARQQTATAALLRYRLRRGSLFISNNVPYILALNEGSSDQAPAGFVQDSIQAGIRSVTNETLS